VRADFEAERFGDANAQYAHRSIQVTQFMSVMGPLLTIFVNIGVVIVIYAGGLEAIRGEMTTGEIVAFTNYMLTTMGPLIMMTMLSQVWANGLASMARVHEVLDVIPSVQQAADAVALPAGTPGRVTFENVWFRYGSGDSADDILADISFEAQPGQTVAILGWMAWMCATFSRIRCWRTLPLCRRRACSLRAACARTLPTAAPTPTCPR